MCLARAARPPPLLLPSPPLPSCVQRFVRQAEAGGCRALFVTVDAPQLGRRDKDMRHKFTASGPSVVGSTAQTKAAADSSRAGGTVASRGRMGGSFSRGSA
jgi:isopentenyl diphosphate isomerase/L-lactate dehydrogenase-like FMN-dependent dehydrogenase